MSIHIGTQTITATGPTVQFDCPACGATGVTSEVSEAVERSKLYHVIPLFTFTETWVTCPSCRRRLNLAAPLRELAGLRPEAVSDLIRYRAPRSAAILAVLSCVLFWVPVLGAVLAAIAVYLARGTRGWPKGLAKVSLILGVAVTATVVVVAFLPK